MPSRPRRIPLLALLFVPVLAATTHGQKTPQERGFLAKADPAATGVEISEQGNLWVMEVRFKPMRLATVNLTDPKSGEKRRTLVWYLVYEAVRRPLARRADPRNLAPMNEVDPPPGPAQFVPEFTLVSNDNGKVRVYHDEILPEAVAAISTREKIAYRNGAEVIGDAPEETAFDAPTETVVQGVATFRNVDPDVDFFTLFATGFSNGYRITDGPGGESLVWRKTVVQKYWRPGDRFAQSEREFRFRGEPTWIYRPDAPANPLVGTGDEPDATDGDAADE